MSGVGGNCVLCAFYYPLQAQIFGLGGQLLPLVLAAYLGVGGTKLGRMGDPVTLPHAILISRSHIRLCCFNVLREIVYLCDLLWCQLCFSNTLFDVCLFRPTPYHKNIITVQLLIADCKHVRKASERSLTIPFGKLVTVVDVFGHLQKSAAHLKYKNR